MCACVCVCVCIWGRVREAKMAEVERDTEVDKGRRWRREDGREGQDFTSRGERREEVKLGWMKQSKGGRKRETEEEEKRARG